MKRIISIILAAVLLLSTPGQTFVAYGLQRSVDNRLEENTGLINEENRREDREKKYPTGLIKDEIIKIDVENIDMDTQAEAMVNAARPLSEEYHGFWDTYSTNYFYNLSTNEEKKLLWDALDRECIGFMYGNSNAKYVSAEDGNFYYHTGFLTVEGWNLDEVYEFVQVFRANNPQYYFLNNMFLYDESDGAIKFALGVYKAFASEYARDEATKAFGEQIDAWKKELANCTSDEEILYEIHRLICEKVDYNEAIFGTFDEETEFTQSAYSVMCMDKTVCAGYAEAVALMCNAMGIDALCVTSIDHQWNKVRINDQWYNVDATWADQSYGIDYEFYLRSDDYYDNAAEQDESHQEEEFWEKYLPICSLDAETSDYSEPGVLPIITDTTDAPIFEFTETEGGFYVNITSNTSGATIYYTIDGRTPSVAFTKSIRYDGNPFFIKDDVTLKAIAVKDGRYDSEISLRNGSVAKKTVNIKERKSVLDGIQITWERIYEAEGYNIYRGVRTSLTGYKWEKIATITDNATTQYVDTTIKSGEEFYYCVRAYLETSESYGEPFEIGFYEMPRVQSIVQNEYDLTIAWEPVNGALSYQVYVKVEREWARWILVADTEELTYTHSFIQKELDVKPGEIVKVFIMADGFGGYSVWDEELATEYVFESWEGLIINPFNDVSIYSYYYEPVLWAVDNGITSGLTPTEFGPKHNCTRGQIVTFLWRAAGCPEPTSNKNPFTDVDTGEYYTKAVLWALENNITTGLKPTLFGTEETCTRAQIVTFLWRTFGCKEPETMNNPFIDVPVDAYYTKAVLWAVENEITTGLTEDTFGPEAFCTRGQVVTFLYRAYKEE